MEFRILGPLEVVDGSRSLPLGGTKQRALLAVLVLNANRVISTDRLIDALWGETPPEGAAHTVQVYVSQIRKALRAEDARPPDDLLVTQGRGYVLRVQDGKVDLQRFEKAIEEGRQALSEGAFERASFHLRDALDLWRGPPLEGLEFEPFVEPFIGRIEDLRLSAIEDRIEADLALGRHVHVGGELRSLVSEFPLRERLRGQLMLALYRSGRQAEALQAYRDAKQTLAEELGIDPNPELQRLERAILQQAPELDLANVPETGQWAGAAGEGVADRGGRRSGKLFGVGVALLAIVVIGSVTLVVATRSGIPSPSEVPANSVGRIDPDTGDVVAAIPTTRTAPSAVVWADGSLWVANTVSRTLARIDPETNRVVQAVPTGTRPFKIQIVASLAARSVGAVREASSHSIRGRTRWSERPMCRPAPVASPSTKETCG
jgi:YVTN family beta-propeller protein